MRCEFKLRRCAGTATVSVTDTDTGKEHVVCQPCLRRAIIDRRPAPDLVPPERHPGRC